MGIRSLLRNPVAKAVGLVGLVASAFTFSPRTASAEQIIALIANLEGKEGSHWMSDVIMNNPYTVPIQVRLQGTPHNTSASASDPELTHMLQPGETIRVEDAYGALFGGEARGKARLVISTTDMQGNTFNDPITTTNIYNSDGNGGEFQTTGMPVTLHPAGTTLGDTTVKGPGERYNFDVTTGPEWTRVEFIYRDSMGQNEKRFTQDIPPNATRQYANVTDSFDIGELGPNSSITAVIHTGSAAIRGTPVNNQTNDGRSQQWQVYTMSTTGPKIVGLDLDGDGVANMVDEDGDHILDSVIDTSCTAPFPYNHQIITNSEGSVNFNSAELPQGMDLHPGTGAITYNPPCSDSGQVFTPSFTVTDGYTTSTPVIVQYRVGD